MDPKVRGQALYQARVSRMDQWRQFAAQEFMHHIERAKIAKTRGQKPSKDRRAPRRWLDRTFESLPAVASWAKYEREKTLLQRAMKARQEFKKHLCEIYGDEVRAFRRSLDPHVSYCFTLKTLRRYCQKHNLHINVWDLWRGLDRDGDSLVRLEEYSSQHAFALADLRRWAQADPELGSVAAIWSSPQAREASRDKTGTWYSEKKMMTSTFLETLKRVGWPGAAEASSRRLVVAALDFHGCQVITKGDLEWLDRWAPQEWLYSVPDPAALQEVRELLVRAYGHPLAAWRKELDADDSNNVTWLEWREACRRFGFTKAGGAWRALDEEACGSISLVQFDPESADLLRSFKEWAEVNWGSVRQCFKHLDTDGDGTVNLAELKRACHKLHWDGDVPVLFDCLDVEGKVTSSTGQLSRSLTFASVAFLDTWHFDVTEQDLAADEAVTAAPRRKRTRAKDVDAITARLTIPIGLPRSLSSPALLPERPAAGGSALPSVGGSRKPSQGDSAASRDPQEQQEQQQQPGSGGDGAPQSGSRGSSLAVLLKSRPGKGRVRPLGAGDRAFTQRVDTLLEWERTWG